jgi:hypothetical protein
MIYKHIKLWRFGNTWYVKHLGASTSVSRRWISAGEFDKLSLTLLDLKGGWTKESWVGRLRHIAYAGGWKKSVTHWGQADRQKGVL